MLDQHGRLPHVIQHQRGSDQVEPGSGNRPTTEIAGVSMASAKNNAVANKAPIISHRRGLAAPNRRVISAYKARLPPSPLLSQRITMKTYLIVMTKTKAQKIRLTIPYRSMILV